MGAGAPSIESASFGWAVAFGLQCLDHVPQMPDGESRFVKGRVLVNPGSPNDRFAFDSVEKLDG